MIAAILILFVISIAILSYPKQCGKKHNNFYRHFYKENIINDEYVTNKMSGIYKPSNIEIEYIEKDNKFYLKETSSGLMTEITEYEYNQLKNAIIFKELNK